jgi:hypothetical protein
MKMFMGLLFIFGLFLTIYFFKIDQAVEMCSDKTRKASRGLLVMGIIMLSVSSTFMVCGCGMLQDSSLGIYFVLTMLILGITTVVLSSIINSECDDTSSDTTVITTIGILIIIASGGYLSFKGYNMIKDNQMKRGIFGMKTSF